MKIMSRCMDSQQESVRNSRFSVSVGCRSMNPEEKMLNHAPPVIVLDCSSTQALLGFYTLGPIFIIHTSMERDQFNSNRFVSSIVSIISQAKMSGTIFNSPPVLEGFVSQFALNKTGPTYVVPTDQSLVQCTQVTNALFPLRVAKSSCRDGKRVKSS